MNVLLFLVVDMLDECNSQLDMEIGGGGRCVCVCL